MPADDTVRLRVSNTLAFAHWISSRRYIGFQLTKTTAGLRIDSVKDVDKASMPPFCEAANVYCLGELSNNDPSYAYPYVSPWHDTARKVVLKLCAP